MPKKKQTIAETLDYILRFETRSKPTPSLDKAYLKARILRVRLKDQLHLPIKGPVFDEAMALLNEQFATYELIRREVHAVHDALIDEELALQPATYLQLVGER